MPDYRRLYELQVASKKRRARKRKRKARVKKLKKAYKAFETLVRKW